jgi:oligopeptide/dipeptide ABC transporter ATP-binding protein
LPPAGSTVEGEWMHHLLEVNHVKEYFPGNRTLFGPPVWVRAVDGVTFYIDEGETLGLVGESGCGKSTIALMILCLIEPTAGKILYQGKDIFALSKDERMTFRRDVQIVFQDPYSSLNPRKTVEEVLSRPFKIHGEASRKHDIRERIYDLLNDVGLTPPESFMERYPHEMSGGQRQRVAIARAIALKPKLVIADEAVSSLDVSIRAQILNLMKELQNKYHLAYLFITHDLATLRSVSHRVAVTYLGKLMEIGSTEDVFKNPMHPYTRALLASVPVPDPVYSRERKPIFLSDSIPSPLNPPSGCRFHTRCLFTKDSCMAEEPSLTDIGNHHLVACSEVRSSAGVQLVG